MPPRTEHEMLIALTLVGVLTSALYRKHQNMHKAESWADEQHRYDREFDGIKSRFYRETA